MRSAINRPGPSPAYHAIATTPTIMGTVKLIFIEKKRRRLWIPMIAAKVSRASPYLAMSDQIRDFKPRLRKTVSRAQSYILKRKEKSTRYQTRRNKQAARSEQVWACSKTYDKDRSALIIHGLRWAKSP